MDKQKWWQTRKSRLVFISGAAISIAGLIIWFFWFYPYITTDDARVAATMIRVAPLQQSGRITTVHTKEGDRVRKGDLLVELDHDRAQAELLKAQARLTFAERELARYTRGNSMHIAMQHDVDLMQRDLAIARAEFQLAQENLDDTYLRSPCDGIVVRNLAEVGNILEPRQTAQVIADVKDAWISANVEETSIASIRAGQPVRIHVDEGYDLKGSVAEVIHATASQFALIPSDNASGNFTKVVQRIPIKVVIDPHEKMVLRVGQSVELKVKVH